MEIQSIYEMSSNNIAHVAKMNNKIEEINVTPRGFPQ
jgi:hypothetical protein